MSHYSKYYAKSLKTNPVKSRTDENTENLPSTSSKLEATTEKIPLTSKFPLILAKNMNQLNWLIQQALRLRQQLHLSIYRAKKLQKQKTLD